VKVILINITADVMKTRYTRLFMKYLEMCKKLITNLLCMPATDLVSCANVIHFHCTCIYISATLHALKKRLSSDNTADLTLSQEDLAYGFQLIKPSAMKEVTLEVSKVRYYLPSVGF
jgi:hypothetical protein